MTQVESHNIDDVVSALELPGLDGSNPVGFLAALGVFQTLSRFCDDIARLSWHDDAGRWIPVLHGRLDSVSEVASILANELKCPFAPNPNAEKTRERLQKVFDGKKTELKRAQDALKKKKLRGKERDDEHKRMIAPIEAEVAECRRQWLAALRACVPSSEMALGKHLNATLDEFHDTLSEARSEVSHQRRTVVDLLTAFGSDVCNTRKGNRMEPTPFCFVTGSGHQYFLDTARQLTESVDAARLEAALANPLEPADEKLSMRWDPSEDRRYALMWDDPTASGNKTLTNWATNLLAYHGLQCFPTVPTRKGLATVGWSSTDDPCWMWPIWVEPISLDVARSLLGNVLRVDKRTGRSELHEIGVVAIYQTTRLQVGNPPLHKVNFSPAERIV
jgi:hypothetical protein